MEWETFWWGVRLTATTSEEYRLLQKVYLSLEDEAIDTEEYGLNGGDSDKARHVKFDVLPNDDNYTLEISR